MVLTNNKKDRVSGACALWEDMGGLRRVKDTPNLISAGSQIVKCLRRRQCDPLIIERTICLVFGPSTALYRPFLKHCTLTNKAVGTICDGWRVFIVHITFEQMWHTDRDVFFSWHLVSSNFVLVYVLLLRQVLFAAICHVLSTTLGTSGLYFTLLCRF